MKRTFMMVMLAVAMMSLAASAGTISGKVSGVSGESVVYVEAIAGKTFPAPTAKPVIDQKGLMFAAAHRGGAARHDGRVPEQRQGCPQRVLAFGRRQQETHPQPGHLADRAKSVRSSSTIRVQCRCCAMSIRRCRAMSSYRRLRTSRLTDKSGAYKIENVPDGSYTVTAWHEGAKNQSKPVAVAGDSKADFTLSK